jgi:hypothetical protein
MAEYVQHTLENSVNRQPLKSEISVSQLTELYIDSLSSKEKKAYLIARDHLGMSFTLEKSVGFLQWKKQYSPTLQTIK